jgi:hypothetical protein
MSGTEPLIRNELSNSDEATDIGTNLRKMTNLMDDIDALVSLMRRPI